MDNRLRIPLDSMNRTAAWYRTGVNPTAAVQTFPELAENGVTRTGWSTTLAGLRELLEEVFVVVAAASEAEAAAAIADCCCARRVGVGIGFVGAADCKILLSNESKMLFTVGVSIGKACCDAGSRDNALDRFARGQR
jgi:hypothetical protein